MGEIFIDFPRRLQPLFSPSRFKSIRGGRDSGKSWGAARALIEMGAAQKHFIVCARETMESMKDSVHRTLCDQIERMGFSSQYKIEQAIIRHVGCPGITASGTEFVFRGLKNPDALKSLEGATIAWIEEAQGVSEESWRKVIPTVRRDDSEIWLTWNPELESDPTYRRFVLEPPPGLIDIEMNFSDNPWYSKVLEPQRKQEEAKDPDEYAHIWLGKCRKQLSGAIYANELRLAESQGRIGQYPFNPNLPVDTGWDLGDSDLCCIWFFQRSMGQYRAVDYLEDNHKPLSHYLSLLEGKPYKYGKDYFPWDASSKMLVGSLEETMRSRGRNVVVMPRQPRAAGIDASREMLGTCWFHEPTTIDGVNRLRYYRQAPTKIIDPVSGDPVMSMQPIHDQNSHGCLTGDSLVLMEDGTRRRIDTIAAGESVWTPRGSARVMWAGKTKTTNDLIEIETPDGYVLRCTPEHKIFTVRGLIRSDALRYNDSVLKGTEWINGPISFFSKARNTGFRETITDATYGDQKGRLTCTAQSGRILTALSRLASRFTMSMGITSTMGFPIYSYSPSMTTSGCMPLSALLPAHSSPQLRRAASVPPNGTDPLMESHGTGNTDPRHGKAANGLRRCVRNAANALVRLFLRAPSSATPIARLSRVEGDWASVYDLTIEKHACYQANGMLVSNSDAFRTIAMGYRRPQPPKPEAPKAPPRPYNPVSYSPFG